jgi:hypothetical protein
MVHPASSVHPGRLRSSRRRARGARLLLALPMAGALLAFACQPVLRPPRATSTFPNALTTGANTRVALAVISHDVTVTRPNTVIRNKRFTHGANLWVRARNVTVANSVFEGGRVNNHDMSNKVVYNGMVVDHVTFTNIPGQRHNTTPEHIFYRVGDGGYVAEAVQIDRQQEGFRLGGADHGGTDVMIADSYVLIDTYGDARWNGSKWVADEGTNHVDISSPTSPNNAPCDGHPDGVQGYVGPHAVIIHNTFDEAHYGPGTCNDSPLFIADDSLGADVINNALLGGGYSERLHSGRFTSYGNRIGRNQWGYGPIACRGESSFRLVGQSGNLVAAFDSGNHVVHTYQAIGC